MGGLLDILKGPVEALVGKVGDIIDDLNLSGEEKARMQIELAALQNEFSLKVLEADYKIAASRAETIKAEVASKSWLARNWRPILMLSFTYIILHNFVIAPLFGVPAVTIPADMWDLLKIGVGGYIFGRTFEKTAPTIAESVARRRGEPLGTPINQ